MFLSNKSLYNSYKNILLRNEIIVLCELSDLDIISLKNLKLNSIKEGFHLKRVKNKVFKSLFKDPNLQFLINGSIYLLYKKKLNFIKNIKENINDFLYASGLSILYFTPQNKIYKPFLSKSFKANFGLSGLALKCIKDLKGFIFIRLGGLLRYNL